MKRMERETRYKKWMEKVTQNAVDKALQFRTISPRTNGLQIGIANFGPSSILSRSMSFSGSSLSRRKFGQSKNWTLDVHSTERRSMAASIYALLLQWKPDISGQWASRVAAVVPIFEEALYQNMSNLEDYKNTTLLDLHLRQILRQFESGNGPLFFSHQPSENSLTKGRAEEQERMQVAKAKSVRTHNFAKSTTDHVNKIKTATPNDQLLKKEENLQSYAGVGVPKENCHPARKGLQLTEREADKALWDAFFTGNLKEMEESFSKYQNYGSKNLVKRVAGLISTKKQGESILTKEVLQNACADKINMYSLDYREASEVKSPQHVLSERNANAEPENSSKTDGSCKRISAFVNGAVSSPQRLFVEEGSFMLRADQQACPTSVSSGMPFNQINSSNVNYEIKVNLQVEDLDRPQAQPHAQQDQPQTQLVLKSAAVSSDTLNNLSTFSVMPVRNEDLGESAVLSHGQVESPGLSSESASYHTSIRELKISEHEDHRELIPLHTLFQLDDDEADDPVDRPSLLLRAVDECSVGDIAEGSRVSVESPSAGSSQDQPQWNGEQAGNANHTESSITEDAVLRLQTHSFRVSLLSLLRERDHVDGRVSLMSLLREREDYEVVIFDQEMLASISKSNRCLKEDDCEPSEMHVVCCVCMVGQRGAAFVPCGHTFCRNCASELQMSRGACPLCNRSIKQILKLY